MADNLGYTPGTGATVAADDIAGIAYQRIKVVIGADGTNDGDVSSANPLPVTASTLPLPSGASTAAKQDTGNTSLSSIDGKVPALGQALAAASVPVVLTAAQIATITPPAAITGYATEITLATRLAEATFTTRIPVQGQAAMAASVPVVIASNQSAVPISAAALPLPTGAATETTQLLQATEATLLAIKTLLNITPGTDMTGITGPMIQALVSDTPESYIANTIRPASITPEGRLRVSAVNSDVMHCWQNTFNDPFDGLERDFTTKELSYV